VLRLSRTSSGFYSLGGELAWPVTFKFWVRCHLTRAGDVARRATIGYANQCIWVCKFQRGMISCRQKRDLIHDILPLPPLPPSLTQRNIRPTHREQRVRKNDKVALERSRLMARSGWQARMHQKNAPETTAGLTSCRPNDEGYLSNADRFHSDVAGEEFELRQEALRKQQQGMLFRREKMRVREEDKWKKFEEDQQAQELYWIKVREDANLQVRRTAKKNVSNVAYDITNLQYNQDTSGEMQRYLDEMVKVRAQTRTRALVVLGDSRAPYNILTGEERKLPPKAVPLYSKPDVPNQDRLERVDYRRADAPFELL